MQQFSSLSDPKVSELLLSGATGVLPTDTTYGLVALAADRLAVSRLYRLKSRRRKPGTITAHDIDQLVSLGVTRRYLKAVSHFWPNSISIIIPLGQTLDYLGQAVGSAAFRIPKGGGFSDLLEKTGPLLTTSANYPGKPPAQTIAKARQYFGDTVDFYVDGGDLSDRQPSTIIRIIDDAIEVIRTGSVRVDSKGISA